MGIASADDEAFSLTDSRITECSGMATDTSRQYYWAINDTESEGGRIYAIRTDGDTVSSITYGADVYDTEALAYRDGLFYVGDIGDNAATRDTISVYTVSGSDPGATGVTYTRYQFSYPEGPRDAEGMFVTAEGRIYIVTKEKSGAIYAAPTDPSTSSVNELTKVASAPSLATDATALANGQVVIRTYTTVALYDGSTFEKLGQSNAPTQEQGESVTETISGSAVLLASEGQYSDVVQVAVPSSASASPSASATTTPSTTVTASATAQPTASGSTDSSQPGSTGTRTVLLAAAGLALVAGIVVYLRR